MTLLFMLLLSSLLRFMFWLGRVVRRKESLKRGVEGGGGG